MAAVERVPLSERGLPASTYELVRRAASLWRDRPALSVLPDAESFRTPLVRTFAELARDVHGFQHRRLVYHAVLHQSLRQAAEARAGRAER